MNKAKNNKKRIAGFSMIELMAVLIVIGLLGGLVALNIGNFTDRGRITTTRAKLKNLHGAVNQFKSDTGRYPSEEEGLIILIEDPGDVSNYPEGGYIETTEIPLDGWDNEFYYELYPPSGKPFHILSFGADGEPGGEGVNADLSSTDAY
ncbi:PilD-dependent protein PddA [Limihaloglobus sulfuriphilus]|uniref:Type II secretion system core protein G n=1 Tax=Limihaloglobus sulfuriphilus TaxID=1851148 RepID=A0A1Q2MHX0_9BACT|nr:type II secretion system major pseudopilin GspG [Limihaloglobus sulfuriphilus]AQQ72254.1 PilD-dependent protein PddA [Limihaloglobus sulfuriphilus]